ncbi:hypothetical protein D3C84_1290090 [compost metagenome]
MGLVGLAHSFWLVALTYAIAAIGIRCVRSLNATPDRSTLPAHTYHNSKKSSS